MGIDCVFDVRAGAWPHARRSRIRDRKSCTPGFLGEKSEYRDGTIADQLADDGIRVNTVNPGPVDTGYLTEEMLRTIAPMFPHGRYGVPDDPARLIAWLVTDEAAWITGQVINTEGGFGRHRPRGQ